MLAATRGRLSMPVQFSICAEGTFPKACGDRAPFLGGRCGAAAAVLGLAR
jgi:hypothetical protein